MQITRKPAWLRAILPSGPGFTAVRQLVEGTHLHTVCQSAQCPNLGECWSRGTATVMILGNVCTRACGFCAIRTGRPAAPDLGEPARVAEAGAAIPPSAWRYGRVIAVAEGAASPKDRPKVRRNVEAAIQQLNDLGVVVEEWPGR